LLIAIAVAAAVLVYVFAIGLLGSLQGNGGQQMKDQLILEAWKWAGTTLTLNFRNTGSSTINIAAANFYLNGTQTPTISAGCQVTLTPTQGCSGTITIAAGAWNVGQAYPFKVALADGGVFSYALIDGGSA